MKTIEPSAVWTQPWLGPCCAVADFNADGDGQEEVLISDRTTLWIFRREGAAC